MRRNGKVFRMFQQMVPVLDRELFARLQAQVRVGDTVQVTILSRWYVEGYSTQLENFALLVPPSTVQERESLVASA